MSVILFKSIFMRVHTLGTIIVHFKCLVENIAALVCPDISAVEDVISSGRGDRATRVSLP